MSDLTDTTKSTGWPTSSDLGDLFASAGIALPDACDPGSALEGAIDEFEERAGYVPFIADTDDSGNPLVTTRYFDGPGSNILDVQAGLVSLTQLTIATAVYIEGQQFFLKPLNAPYKRKPYTYIDFGHAWMSLRDFDLVSAGAIGYVPCATKAIAITGVWGYCTASTLPAQAFNAVLRKAALTLAPQVDLMNTDGVHSVKDLNLDVEFAPGRGVTQLQSYIEIWKADFEAAISRFKRISF